MKSKFLSVECKCKSVKKVLKCLILKTCGLGRCNNININKETLEWTKKHFEINEDKNYRIFLFYGVVIRIRQHKLFSDLRACPDKFLLLYWNARCSFPPTPPCFPLSPAPGPLGLRVRFLEIQYNWIEERSASIRLPPSSIQLSLTSTDARREGKGRDET